MLFPEHQEARLFLRRVFLFFAPVISVVLLVNLLVDPADLLSRSSVKREIARALMTGHNVLLDKVPTNWGVLQSEVVRSFHDGRPPVPNTLVWGTSRSSELTTRMFPGRSFFNQALPGGSILDYIAMYGLFKQYGVTPRTVLISLDPWTFYAQVRRALNGRTHNVPAFSEVLRIQPSFEASYRNGIEALGAVSLRRDFLPLTEQWTTKAAILSPAYLQLSIAGMGRRLQTTDQSFVEDRFVIRRDGSYSLSQWDRVKPKEVAAIAEDYVSLLQGSLCGPKVAPARYVRLFEKLIAGMKRDGSRVVLYLSPLHPIVFDRDCGPSGNVLERYLRTLAARENLAFVGSFDPHRYALTAERPFFADSYHPTAPAVEAIIKAHAPVFASDAPH